MKGYPAGTRCVITCVRDGSTKVRLGEVVTVGHRTYPPGTWTADHISGAEHPTNYWSQEIADIPSTRACFAHRIDWLKPLEDPYTQTLDERIAEEA